MTTASDHGRINPIDTAQGAKKHSGPEPLRSGNITTRYRTLIKDNIQIQSLDLATTFCKITITDKKTESKCVLCKQESANAEHLCMGCCPPLHYQCWCTLKQGTMTYLN